MNTQSAQVLLRVVRTSWHIIIVQSARPQTIVGVIVLWTSGACDLDNFTTVDVYP